MSHDPARDLTTRALFCRFVGTTGAEKYNHMDALRYFSEVMTMRERDSFCGMLADNIHRIEDGYNAQAFMRARLTSMKLSTGSVR